MKRVFILSSLFYTALASQVWIQKEGTSPNHQYKLYGDGLNGKEFNTIALRADVSSCKPETNDVPTCKTKWTGDWTEYTYYDIFDTVDTKGLLTCSLNQGNNIAITDDLQTELVDMGTCLPLQQPAFQIEDKAGGDWVVGISLPSTIDIVGTDCPDVWDNTAPGWENYEQCGTTSKCAKASSGTELNDSCEVAQPAAPTPPPTPRPTESPTNAPTNRPTASPTDAPTYDASECMSGELLLACKRQADGKYVKKTTCESDACERAMEKIDGSTVLNCACDLLNGVDVEKDGGKREARDVFQAPACDVV